MSNPIIDNRSCERFRLEPMLTAVCVTPTEPGCVPLDGHAYDISESGVRFELDEPIAPGRVVWVSIELPAAAEAISASGPVVWVHDVDDDPGPRRMAVRFEEFGTQRDLAQLRRHLGVSRRIAA